MIGISGTTRCVEFLYKEERLTLNIETGWETREDEGRRPLVVGWETKVLKLKSKDEI